jgi:hypothetical protein
MRKLILVTLCALTLNVLTAQSKNTIAKFSYYIELKNVNTKQAVKELNEFIRSKNSSIKYFLSYGVPTYFHMLYSDVSISEATFKSWIISKGYVLQKFQVGNFDMKFVTQKKKDFKNPPKVKRKMERKK